MIIFSKPPLTIAEHLAQWQDRGMQILDPIKASRYLSVISYYRLSAYTLPFQLGKGEHRFHPNVSFEDVLDLYIFDRRLRLLILDAIERIEVALRARMTDVLASHHGAHAYLKKEIFDTRYNHSWLMEQVSKKCNDTQAETFIKHYRETYSEPSLPPIWMVMEILTFKEVSSLFTNLRLKEDKQAIASFWSIQDTVLRSWFRALSDLRNVCAHHSRTWNREFGSKPLVPKRRPAEWPDLSMKSADPRVEGTHRLFYLLVVITYLLRKINPSSNWVKRLYGLLQDHPKVSKAHMGMPERWNLDPYWRL